MTEYKSDNRILKIGCKFEWFRDKDGREIARFLDPDTPFTNDPLDDNAFSIMKILAIDHQARMVVMKIINPLDPNDL